MTLDSEDSLAEWGALAVQKIQRNVREIVTRCARAALGTSAVR